MWCLALSVLYADAMGDPHLVVALLALTYALLAAVDGIWLHLWRYQLHVKAQEEHALHTGRAVLFSAVVVLLFMGWANGALLWLGAGIAVADVALVAWDAALETRTRTFQQGLPAPEAALHVVLQTLHVILVICAIVAKPWASWLGNAIPAVTPSPLTDGLLLVVFGGSLVVVLIHLALWRPVRALVVRVVRRDGQVGQSASHP